MPSRASPLTIRMALLLASLAGCPGGDDGNGAPAPASPPERFVVLGFDGVDPDLVREMWAGGRLPALKALAEEGTFADLRSTTPPESPVAWSTFATGKLPGKHGVFDFVVRDPSTYRPEMGTVEYFPLSYDATGEPTGRQEGRTVLVGDPFWLVASRAGIEAKVLDVPYTWPPVDLPLGGVAAGLGTPDLIATNSTCTVFSTDFPDPPPSLGGVRTVRLEPRDGAAQATIQGPRRSSGARAEAPVAFSLIPERPGSLRISTQAAVEDVPAGGWSGWLVVDLPVGHRQVKGQVRFLVVEASAERMHVYMTPVCSDPQDPWVQLSSPESLARDLMAVAGRYTTVGWEEDTQALNTEMIGEDAWLEQVYRVMDQRTAMALAALDAGPPPLFVAAWTAPDRVSHMFWRLRDPSSPRYDPELAARAGHAVEDSYDRMDAIVAAVRARLPAGTTLIILSDHGFHAFDRQLHVNRWLVDHGYLVLKEGGTTLADADWSRTRAYSLGTGQIYVNLKDREGSGIVAFGQEQRALVDQIRRELKELVDPEAGGPVMRDAVPGADIYTGGGAARAPDLQLAFAPGYQSSWATKLGGVPAELLEDNPKKWSGDHAASSAEETKGILFVSRKVAVGDAGIEDLAPTILHCLGVPPPEAMDGRVLFDPLPGAACQGR